MNHAYNMFTFGFRKLQIHLVIATLYRTETGEDVKGMEQGNLIKKKFFSAPSSLSPERLAIVESYFSFMVVRDPVSRIVSAYKDKVVRKTKHSAVVYRYFHRSEDEQIEFDEFVSFLENGGVQEDPHWMPQVDFILEDSRFPIELARLSN